MSAARAMVVTDVGDNARLFTPGVSGVLIPPRHAAALGKAVDALLSDPARRTAMAAAARREFEQTFTVERMVDRYEAVYARLTETRRAA